MLLKLFTHYIFGEQRTGCCLNYSHTTYLESNEPDARQAKSTEDGVVNLAVGRLGSTTTHDRENPAAWRPKTARGTRSMRPGGQEGTTRPKSRLGNRPVNVGGYNMVGKQ